jgi:hypothetical protein
MDPVRVLQEGEWYRLLTAHITFGSTGEVVLGTLMLAHFSRRFERELGSRKLVLFLLQVHLVAIPLVWIITAISIMSGSSSGKSSAALLSYAGPYPTLGALLYLFYRYTPRLYPRFVGMVGFHVSEKAIPYALALQLVMYRGMATWIPTICGSLGAWWAIRHPMDVVLPNRVADLVTTLASPLVDAPPAMLAPAAATTNTAATRHAPPHQPRAIPRRGGAATMVPQPLPRAVTSQPPQPQPPSPENIEQLTSMGFDRETVVRALQQSNNSVERALDRLLGGT